MRLLTITLILIIGSIIILLALSKLNLNPQQRVPVIPNESIITAEVLDYHPPRIWIKYPRITIRILSSRAVEDLEDFGSMRIGKELVVYSRDKISHELVGRRIMAHFVLLGDERGRAYWIWGIETIDP